MVQEDQNQMCSNSSSGGGNRSASKPLKQKKVPQRGLGVAQLEKIRIEEQQKNDAPNAVNFSSPSNALSPTHSSSVSTVPFFNYSHKSQSTPSIPFQASSPPLNFPSSNRLFKTRSTSNLDNFHLGSITPMNPSNGEAFNIGWPLIPTHGNHANVSLPMLCNPYELNLHQKGENSRVDNHGLLFRSSMSLPYANCSIDPQLDTVPRTQHYQQPSSLINMSSISSSSSSSSSVVLNFPMEPTSSQSYYSSYSTLWPDEEKIMIGLKRSCPFPLDDPTIPTFNRKFSPITTHAISRTDESTSWRNGGITFNFEPSIPVFREVPSCLSAMHEPTNTKKSNRSQNDDSNGEFLSLAPPAIASYFPNSRLKQSSTIVASHNQDLCNFESLPYQGSIEDLVVDSGQVGSSQQPKFFNLFPTTKERVRSMSSPTRRHSCNGHVGESIDLNLQL